jgi:arsenate reductase (thioredoxin)
MESESARPKVLFLCTGNSCRSQIGEAMLRHHAADRFEALSAGTDPKPINPLTERVMAEKGVDISGQRSKDVAEFLGRHRFEYMIVVCDGANQSCPTVFPGVQNRLFWPFDDPATFEGTEEEVLNGFRRVRDEIEDRIIAWLKETPEA